MKTIAPFTALSTNPTRKLSGLIGLLLVGLALSSPAWSAGYTITDLGTLGGTTSWVNGLNNHGQVVGSALTTLGSTREHAFLYSNGAMTDLGTLGGGNSYAYGINDSGQVVGYAATASGVSHAFLYGNGAMTDLGTLGGTSSQAYGINDKGQVAGASNITGSYYMQHAYLYGNGSMTDLGTLGASFAYGINNTGQVVGGALTGSYEHAFLYSNGAMSDLGTLGGLYSRANSINNNGQVVGRASAAGGVDRAFLYSNGAMTNLGTLGGLHSLAYGINDSGQVVGQSLTTDNAAQHAFLYSEGNLLDLNILLSSGSGWTLTSAQDINDLGQIVGYGTINGQTHAYLMTPTTSPVPVPAAAWLLGSGLLGLLGVARRKAA